MGQKSSCRGPRRPYRCTWGRGRSRNRWHQLLHKLLLLLPTNSVDFFNTYINVCSKTSPIIDHFFDKAYSVVHRKSHYFTWFLPSSKVIPTFSRGTLAIQKYRLAFWPRPERPPRPRPTAVSWNPSWHKYCMWYRTIRLSLTFRQRNFYLHSDDGTGTTIIYIYTTLYVY